MRSHSTLDRLLRALAPRVGRYSDSLTAGLSLEALPYSERVYLLRDMLSAAIERKRRTARLVREDFSAYALAYRRCCSEVEMIRSALTRAQLRAEQELEGETTEENISA
jgi:hypothetical protein